MGEVVSDDRGAGTEGYTPHEESVLQQVGADVLSGVVRRALEDDAVDIPDSRCKPISYTNVGTDSRALYRLAGTARRKGERVPWSVVLKVYHAPTGVAAQLPSDDHYYKREALAYASGLLHSHSGGLAVPKIFGLSEPDHGAVWLWMEVVKDAPGSSWSLDRYGLAVRHLDG